MTGFAGHDDQQKSAQPDPAIVARLALYWRTAKEALESLGEKPTAPNMHMMFEEAAKECRKRDP